MGSCFTIKALRSKGGVVNIHVVRAVTKALIESNPSMSTLIKFDMPRSWVQSIYTRMGFTRRMGTTTPSSTTGFVQRMSSRVRDVYNIIKEHDIPPELVLNADQTPPSYVSVGKSTMTERGE